MNLIIFEDREGEYTKKLLCFRKENVLSHQLNALRSIINSGEVMYVAKGSQLLQHLFDNQWNDSLLTTFEK